MQNKVEGDSMKKLAVFTLALILLSGGIALAGESDIPPSIPPWYMDSEGNIKTKKPNAPVIIDGNAVIGGVNLGVGYGLRWNSSTDAYTLGIVNNGYFTPSPSLTSFPVQERMKRCVLSDAGVVQYYLCATNSALKADCVTASVLDGTDGQVMVEIPKFYYLSTHDGVYRYFLIGEGPFSLITTGGTVSQAAVHPAFCKGGSATASDYRYIGAYEANLYDTSATAYVGGISITEVCSGAGADKLASVSGVLPIVNFTRACGRTMAAARGPGWQQYDNALHAATEVLYLTEYGSFYAQNKIGAGLTTYNTWPNAPQALAGNSNSIGNATGNSSATVNKWAATTAYVLNTDVIPNAAQTGYTYRITTAGTSAAGEPVWPTTIGATVADGTATWTCVRSLQYMSYRGIEHWYGHVWKFVDGANIHNSAALGSRLLLSQNYLQYADDTDSNYAAQSATLAVADGYVTNFMVALGVWPTTVGGGSTTYLTDYYYTEFDTNQESGWRVAVVGGNASYGTTVGPFCVNSYYSSSTANANIGGRLCF
jgi:hypothetical protein